MKVSATGADCSAGMVGAASEQLFVAGLTGPRPAEGTDEYKAWKEENSRNLALASAFAGYLFSGGKGQNVTAASDYAVSAFQNNYLNSQQWDAYLSALEACDGDRDCEVNVQKDYNSLSKKQNDEFYACIARHDTACMQRIQDELRAVEDHKNVIIARWGDLNGSLVTGSTAAVQWAELMDLDRYAHNASMISMGDGNIVTKEQAWEMLQSDKAALCSPAMSSGDCLATIWEVRDERQKVVTAAIASGAGVVVLAPAVVAALAAAGELLSTSVAGVYVACTAGGICTTVVSASAVAGTGLCAADVLNGDNSCVGAASSLPGGAMQAGEELVSGGAAFVKSIKGLKITGFPILLPEGIEINLPGGIKVNGRPVHNLMAPSSPTQRYQLSLAQAEQYLVDMGVPLSQAKSFVESFDGPIYIRIALPGETFGVYSGGPSTNVTAQFLTPCTAGCTPQQVINNLALPEGNPATHLNAATINQSIGILEGVIAPQSWNGGVPGGGWQVFVPGGSQFGTQPVTVGSAL